jgi:ABC-type nitrate/sulfonate/bicarbonate transport system permease component
VNRIARKVLGYVWAVVFIVAGWWISAAIVKSPALPGPTDAIPTFGAEFSVIWPQLVVSAWRVALAMLIGAVLGAPLGVAAGRSRRFDAVFAPVVYFLYPVPKIVLLPVLLVLFGLGGGPKVALIALTVFFQVLVTMRDAGKAVPESAVTAVRSLGGSRWDVYRHVVLPATVPSLFTSLRISTGTAIAVLFFAESIAGTSGLGWYIMNAWGLLDYSSMFAGIIAMALLGIVFYETFNAIEYAMSAWRRAGRAQEAA